LIINNLLCGTNAVYIYIMSTIIHVIFQKPKQTPAEFDLIVDNIRSLPISLRDVTIFALQWRNPLISMKTIELKLSPEQAFDQESFRKEALSKANIFDNEDIAINILQRSIDARKKNVIVNVKCEIAKKQDATSVIKYVKDYSQVGSAKQVVIVGSGPAGLFAALRLIELGVKPVIIERGKDVQERRRDIAAINKEEIVNPASNYCFGEGGAGTYSDGKLYTRSKKRGDVQRILEIMSAHGAREEILYDAHPHIGTNKLPKLIQEMRESILDAGGEIHFNTKVTGLIVDKGELKGVITQDGEKVLGEGVILATGHSARDIFELLNDQKIKIEAKPFALGVRVEHSQQLIDGIQYHCNGERGEFLPAAAYSLVHQVNINGKQRGVFSFCMCPGGFIVPSATAPGEVVVNGMSPSKRDSKFANSGIVVAVSEEDYASYNRFGPLAGMHFQADVEQRACELAGSTQHAPAQRMDDFVKGRVSGSLLETSYQPGLSSLDMSAVLPKFVSKSLQKGFQAFGKKMKGYYTNNAQIVGVESRTSSPVRIPRNKESLEHVSVKRLYPCGEGAGYAGGIVSAAMDGERCAERLVETYINNDHTNR